MPMFVVNTNVAKSDVPAALLSEASEELAKAMGKPAQVGLSAYSELVSYIYKLTRFPSSMFPIYICLIYLTHMLGPASF